MSVNDLERIILDSISVIDNVIKIYNSSNIMYLDYVSYFIENTFYLPDYAIQLSMMMINSAKGSPKILYALKNTMFREPWYISNFFDFKKVVYSYDDFNKYHLSIDSLRSYTKVSLTDFINSFFNFLYHLMVINRLSITVDFIETVLEPINYRLMYSSYFRLRETSFYFQNIDFSAN